MTVPYFKKSFANLHGTIRALSGFFGSVELARGSPSSSYLQWGPPNNLVKDLENGIDIIIRFEGFLGQYPVSLKAY